MPSKPTQDIWHELWDEAGSRGLDTWYVLKGMDSVRYSDHPLSPGPDADERTLGAGDLASIVRKPFVAR